MKIGWFPVVTVSIESQRDKERKSQREEESKSQRGEESKSQRVKESKGQRVKERKRRREYLSLECCTPAKVRQIGYYDTPPPKFSTPKAVFRL